MDMQNAFEGVFQEFIQEMRKAIDMGLEREGIFSMSETIKLLSLKEGPSSKLMEDCWNAGVRALSTEGEATTNGDELLRTAREMGADRITPGERISKIYFDRVSLSIQNDNSTGHEEWLHFCWEWSEGRYTIFRGMPFAPGISAGQYITLARMVNRQRERAVEICRQLLAEWDEAKREIEKRKMIKRIIEASS